MIKKTKILKTLKYLDKNHILTFVFDILLGFLVSLFCVLECKQYISFPLDYNVSLDIIVSLVPAVVTIISISIQAQSDTIRSITIREFSKMRKGFYFSLLHMLLIFVGIFVVETILILFGHRVALLCLDFHCYQVATYSVKSCLLSEKCIVKTLYLFALLFCLALLSVYLPNSRMDSNNSVS